MAEQKKTGATVMQTNDTVNTLFLSLAHSRLTNLHQKAGKVKGVVVDDQAPHVSDNLEDAPADHAGREAPAAKRPALPGVNGQGNAEDGDEDGVGGDARLVSQDAPFQGTQVERAVGEGPEGDEAVGEGDEGHDGDDA